MVSGLKITEENGKRYELYTNSSIPESLKTWFTKKRDKIYRTILETVLLKSWYP